MAALNHVCMWSEHGWIRITAEEAAKLHPGGTVSAESGLFMCDLCGQYVILTDGSIISRYFKHSKKEADKSCPERTFGFSFSYTFSARNYQLPIKINANTRGFRLEIGLIGVPKTLLAKQSVKTVSISTDNGNRFEYSFERLNSNSITYLSVGNEPSKQYTISTSTALAAYWPQCNRGVSPEGAVFDGSSGKLVALDADVQINKKYLVLIANHYSYYFRSTAGLSINKLCEQRIGWTYWNVYEVEATELNETAAKFFLELHCRLTDLPLELVPIWPIHIETPYIIKCNKDTVFMHLTGGRQAYTQAFPYTIMNTSNCPDSSKVISIQCKQRQQLISAGSTKVLQYLYIWKEQLKATTPDVFVSVFDSNDNEMCQARYNKLPQGRQVTVVAPFDGTVVSKLDGQVVDKVLLPAQKRTVIDNIRYGITLQVYQGLDLVWEAEFKKSIKEEADADKILYQKLISCHDELISVPHSFGAVISKLSGYPMTVSWIKKAVKQGFASERAVKLIKKHVVELPIVNRED